MAQDETFATQMRNARIKAGLTQAEVAKKLNVSAQAISNFERGKNNLSPHYAKMLCDLYGIDLSAFNDQPPPDADEVSATVDALIINSYAHDPELFPPVLQCLSSLVNAVDDILTHFYFYKNSYELGKRCAKFSHTLLSAPDSLKGKIARIEGIESLLEGIEDYEQAIIESSPKAIIEEVIAETQADVTQALATFSKQLQAMLETAAQDAQSSLLSAHPSEPPKE